MKVDIKGEQRYFDGFLLKNLDIYKKRLRHKWDSWIAISGDEGDGKSHIAKQICAYVDPNFSVDNIAWTPDQFKEKVLSAGKYSAVLYDEAISGLSARKAMSTINTALISMAAQCRKRNLFVVIVLPSFFDLDKNIAIHRTRALLHVFSSEFSRGFFSYYNKEAKRYLYVQGKKFYHMGAAKPQFTGRFTDWSCVDEDEYERRKDQAMIDQAEGQQKENKFSMQRNLAWYLLAQQGWTHEKIADQMSKGLNIPISRQSVSRGIQTLDYKSLPFTAPV